MLNIDVFPKMLTSVKKSILIVDKFCYFINLLKINRIKNNAPKFLGAVTKVPGKVLDSENKGNRD